MINEIEYKVIQTENSKFIFFRDYLSIYKIEDDVIIDHFQNNKNLPETTKEIINKEFYNANQLIGSYSNVDTEDAPLDTLVLIITRECNLRCKYCYSVDIDSINETMSYEIAAKSILFLIANNPEADEYGIVFFGGEPFMNFQLIKDVVKFAKNEITNKRKKKVNFGLTTNGTILNNEILSFIADELFAIQISMDGSKHNHDKNRVYKNGTGSYDSIINNAMLLKSKNIPFNFRPTFSVETNIFENIIHMEHLKIPFGFGFTLNTKGKSKEITDFGNSNWDSIIEDLNKIVDLYYTKICNNETIHCLNIINSILRIEGKLGKNINCTSGISTLSILPNGKILSCQNFQNHPECIVGDINANYTSSFIKAINVDTISECTNCWVKYLCGGCCYFAKYEENGNFSDPISSTCKLTRLFWEAMLKLHIKLNKKDIITKFLEDYSTTYKFEV